MKRLTRRIRRQFDRGASIQTRLGDPGKPSAFLVRWRERIQGRTRHKSKSFPTRNQADLFCDRVRAKLNIAQSAETLMTGDALRPRDVRLAVTEYVDFRREDSLDRSRYAYNLRLRLMGLVDTFKWKVTTDIPANAFSRIKTHYGKSETFLVREAQVQLRRFVRWARDKYLFRNGLENQKVAKHEEKLYYIWTDAEKDRILAELSAPEEQIILDVEWTERRCNRERRRIKNEYQVRQALYYAIWIQMRWALRPGEVCLLTVRDWNSTTQVLTIPGEICKTGKTRSFRVCPKTVCILDGLARGRLKDDPLFLTARGRSWKAGLMSRQFKRTLEKLGVAGALYSCRHYAATTLMILYKGQARKVMRITGHETLENLERYLLEKEDRMAEIPPEFLTPTPLIAKRGPPVAAAPHTAIPYLPIVSYDSAGVDVAQTSQQPAPQRSHGAPSGGMTWFTWRTS